MNWERKRRDTLREEQRSLANPKTCALSGVLRMQPGHRDRHLHVLLLPHRGDEACATRTISCQPKNVTSASSRRPVCKGDGARGRRLVYTSRFVRVVLAQGPC